jgi:hypothetical protein
LVAYNLTTEYRLGVIADHPSIDFNATKVAYEENTGVYGTHEIYVVNTDGTGRRQITTNAIDDRYPAISGDGQWVAYMEYNSTSLNWDIFVASTDGSQPTTQFVSTSPQDLLIYPPISIDEKGTRITYTDQDDRGITGNLWYVTKGPQGTSGSVHIGPGGANSHPSISGDGTIIACYCYDDYDRTSWIYQVKEDARPPVTSCAYSDIWHAADFTINLTSTDPSGRYNEYAVSGVSQTYYRINDGPTMTVDANGQPLITKEGNDNKLEYWSIDNAGNEEPHNTLTGIKLDKIGRAHV